MPNESKFRAAGAVQRNLFFLRDTKTYTLNLGKRCVYKIEAKNLKY